MIDRAAKTHRWSENAEIMKKAISKGYIHRYTFIRQGDPVFLRRGGIAEHLLSVYLLLKYLTVPFVVVLV